MKAYTFEFDGITPGGMAIVIASTAQEARSALLELPALPEGVKAELVCEAEVADDKPTLVWF